MEISLNSDFDRFINEQMATGLYKSISDIVNDAMKIYIEIKTSSQSQIDMLNAEIQQGIDDYEMDRYMDGVTAYKKLMAKYE